MVCQPLLWNGHTLPPSQVCGYYGVNPEFGLSFSDVSERRKVYGFNELPHEPPKSWLTLIIAQFNDLLIWILLAAAVVSFLLAFFDNQSTEGLRAYVEPLVILVILFLNAVVGVWQESKAEKALSALKELQPQLASCLREQNWLTLSARELVPGDIVAIRVGDKVPADIRLISLKSTILKVEQSQLTGESSSVIKFPDTLSPSETRCEIQSKTNMLFSSTTVVNGHGIGCVCTTGINTEIGMIQAAVKTAASEEETTPLRQKLDEFGQILSYAIAVICITVWLMNFKNFYDPIHGSIFRGCIYYFKISVALAVAAIPEGLPAVITTCLALGTKKMSMNRAIIRKLTSVETLGCTSFICSDKTGTLTTNQMSCHSFSTFSSADKLIDYEAEDYSLAPTGRIFINNGVSRVPMEPIGSDDVALMWLAKCACICNTSKLLLKDQEYIRQGEPTEAALLSLVEKLGCPDARMNRTYLNTPIRKTAMPFCDYWQRNMKHLALLEFSRERKSMSVLCRDISTESNVLLVKGAPEELISRCSCMMLSDGNMVDMTADRKDVITSKINTMATRGLRTIAFAIRVKWNGLFHDYDGPNHHAHKYLMDYTNYTWIEDDLIFIGTAGLLDPPRPEVRDAIRNCRNAGIKVMMITGDNKLTAEAIGKHVGIRGSWNGMQLSFTGREFEALSQQQQIDAVKNDGLILSRMEPRQKQHIVRLLKGESEVIAVTGDGVNDAPALKLADIGVAMGLSGTEVAKEASDMILSDDNFSTIVEAIREGRSIYNNMKAFIRYLISSNIGEVVSIFFTAALGIPEGLAPVQLLWVNLVTDGLPAVALGFNPPDANVMSLPPRKKTDPLISPWVFFRYMVIGLYVGFATVGIVIWWYVLDDNSFDGHTTIPFNYLTKWDQCPTWDAFSVQPVYGMDPTNACTYFTGGKTKASTLSLTVLVVIEMLNAFNALSEYESLCQMPPWANPYLVLAAFGSIFVHCVILYVPFFASIFGVVPLTVHDWLWVTVWSLPVIIIDELLKLLSRHVMRLHTDAHSFSIRKVLNSKSD